MITARPVCTAALGRVAGDRVAGFGITVTGVQEGPPGPAPATRCARGAAVHQVSAGTPDAIPANLVSPGRLTCVKPVPGCVAVCVVLFVLFAYATVTGFDDNVFSIGRSSVPFLVVADRDLGGAAILAWIAGILSVLAALVAGAGSQAHMLYDAGRSRLLPATLGRLRQPSDTPVNGLVVMGAAGLGIIGVWWIIHLSTGHTGSMDPVGLYAECSTMGTIVILVVYLLTNISLPVFMWRRHRSMFSPVRHVAVPALGSAVLVVPFIELCETGQPSPYNAFPYLALGLVAVAAAIAWLTVHRHPATGASEATQAPGS